MERKLFKLSCITKIGSLQNRKKNKVSVSTPKIFQKDHAQDHQKCS